MYRIGDERDKGERMWLGRRVRALLAILALVAYVFAFSGKAFSLPLALSYVPADVNGWRSGDLLVLLSSRVVHVANESYVVACYPGYWNTACVTGRAIVNGVNGVLRISSIYGVNGINNGFLKVYVVTPDFTVYRVVARIPREVVIPVQLVFFAYASIVIHKSMRASLRRALSENTVLLPVLLIVLALNMTVVGATYVEQARAVHRVDGIVVRHEFILNESKLYIHVDTGGVYEVRSASCYVLLGSALNVWGNGDSALPVKTSVLNGIVEVEVPEEIYDELYSKTASNLALPSAPEYVSIYAPLIVKCMVNLDVGSLVVTNLIQLYWRDLNVVPYEDGILIQNPNPVPIKAFVVLFDADSVKVMETWIGRLGEVRLDLRESGFARGKVIVQYKLLGMTRSRVVQVG